MTAASLFDLLAREAQSLSGDASSSRLDDLAVKLVESCLSDLKRVGEYEEQFRPLGPDAARLEAEWTRSIHELHQRWAGEADEVLSRLRPYAANHFIAGLKALEDAYGRVRARLSVTPDQLAAARQQVAQGQGIPVQELRDELRARLRA